MKGFCNANYINHIVWPFHYLDGNLAFLWIFLYSTFCFDVFSIAWFILFNNIMIDITQ